MTDEEKREKRRIYLRELYAFRKENGICVKCGKEKVYKGSVMCLECRMEHRESSMQSYLKHRDNDGYLQKRAETSARTYNRRKEQHICIRCGKKMSDSVTTNMCDRCKVIANRLERDRRHEQGVLPKDMCGNGIYCAICSKPVEKQGEKLCDRCYESVCKNLEKARAAVPLDCYMRRAIQAQWRESKARKDKYNECN